MAKDRSALQSGLITLVKGYQKWISPLSAPSCRFHPTCSSYTIEALSYHGTLKGCWLSAKRILKCHPFHSGGYDPVPTNATKDEK